MGYHITLENSAGELDGRYARIEEDIPDAIIELVSCIRVFSDGDIIRITGAKPKGGKP